MSRQEIVYGMHAMRALLKSRAEDITQIWVQDADSARGRLAELIGQAQQAGISVQYCARKALDDKTGGARHQGIVAQVRAAATLDEQALMQLVESAEAPVLVLALDSIQDPHNLGACMRSADAAGALAIVVPRDKASSLTPVVRKVASGAAESLPLVQVTNLGRTLEQLKQAGLWLTGLAGEAQSDLYDIDFKGNSVLVIGAEGSGLRRNIREKCDYLARIPMQGSVSSLNASVAAGICLFEVVRQRR